MKKFILTLGLLIFVISPAFSQQQETLTVTTYYPSPHGVYKELRLFPLADEPICNIDSEGLIYYDNVDNKIKACRETSPDVFEWKALGEEFWKSDDGVDIYNTNTGNVGIGTTTPQAELEVEGDIIVDGATIGDYTMPTDDGRKGQCLKTNGAGQAAWQPCVCPPNSKTYSQPQSTQIALNDFGSSCSRVPAVYANQASANRVCQVAGYQKAVINRTRGFSSCNNNDVLKWTGSRWVCQYSCSANRWIDSLTCSNPIEPCW